MIRNIFIGITISTILFGCKKYPEDESRGIYTACHRLTNHTWRLNKLLINNVDSSNRTYSTSTISYQYKDLEFKLGKGESSYDKDYNAIEKTAPGAPVAGWRFYGGSHKRSIQFTLIGSNNENFRATTSAAWEIIKLTKNEFILNLKENAKTIRVEFEKI